MTKIISTHSYRGGTGKSNLTANLSAGLAMRGHRVGVVDTDIQSPDRIRGVEPERSARSGVPRVTAGMIGPTGRRQAEEVHHPDLFALTTGVLEKEIVHSGGRLIVLQPVDDKVYAARAGGAGRRAECLSGARRHR